MRLFSENSLAAVTIWQEGEGEPYDDKLMIAETIRNRMSLKYSSDGTVAGTVAKRYQFSAWNDDAGDNARLIASLKLNDNDPIVKDCIRAWHQAVNLETNLANGAVLYCRGDLNPQPSWVKNCMEVARGKHHVFYVEK